MTAGPALAAAASGGIDFLVGKLTDPTFNDSLSPSQGLVVTPHTFSCVEQEGRWKSAAWGYGPGNSRDLLSPITGPTPSKVATKPPADPVRPPSRSNHCPLLTLLIQPALVPNQLPMGLTNVLIRLAGPLSLLLNMSSVGIQNSATVDVTWWDDGLEIWGGYAGLAPSPKPTGFGSVFGHRARIDLAGCPFGNFLPARYLITASGWINPVGAQYYEFRCGVVIKAGSPKPTLLFSSVWDREGNAGTLGGHGDWYVFNIQNWTSTASQLAAHA
jgi:hypothetical protein